MKTYRRLLKISFLCTLISFAFSGSPSDGGASKHDENKSSILAATFTAPADVCVDATIDVYHFLGDPLGGVFSGPGVTDLGNNGVSFTFTPATAGVGVHTITYTVGGMVASDQIEVFALPNVTFTALPDIAIDAGVQNGLSDGSPSGGIYSGPGVTDNGNGTTYSFDPAAAGGGEKTLTYDYTDANGCSNSASDMVTVTTAITVTFTAPADLCLNAGVQTGLSGATPTGGVYSGAGVTDDGNGTTYSFNPATAGVGTHNLTYNVTVGMNMGSGSDEVEVLSLPSVSFTAPNDVCIDVPTDLHSFLGSPNGGVYSGAGVSDLGGGNFTFNPAAAGVGIHALSYTYTDGTTGCSNTASDNMEVFALPTVTFTALPDIAIDAGGQTGLGEGSPNGGIYSGPGVTDDGNGMTYSFDPAAAGGGEKTLTYNYTDGNGCSNSAMDNVVVTTDIPVTFSAPADLCLNDGSQTGLGGGMPTGGTYSGPGVVDDGNGMTYSFDPAVAGVGNHNLTYSVTDGMGGMGSGSDIVEVLALPVVSFDVPADICISAGEQLYIGLANPNGGSFSGIGVTDLGSGNFTFKPAVAGVGTHAITFSYTDGASGCTNMISDNIEVLAAPSVTFVAPEDLCINDGIQQNLAGGQPTGGVYSGAGVNDNGNGLNYSFDPGAAGTGVHAITYSVTGGNGCVGTAADDIVVSSCSGTVTWDGSESTNWDEAANWDSNIVPTIADDVVIPQVATNDPIIGSGLTGVAKSVLITSNGALTVQSNGMLTISAGETPIDVVETAVLIVESGGQVDASP